MRYSSESLCPINAPHSAHRPLPSPLHSFYAPFPSSILHSLYPHPPSSFSSFSSFPPSLCRIPHLRASSVHRAPSPPSDTRQCPLRTVNSPPSSPPNVGPNRVRPQMNLRGPQTE